MASRLSETVPKFTAEALRAAAKQSEACRVVPLRLRRAIKKYIQEQEDPHMKRNVLRLSESFSHIKEVNLLLPTTTSREIVEDPLKSVGCSKRWKIQSAYGDIGLRYQEGEAIAYVASRMPAVYSALYRVLSEVRRRVPDFSPAKVLDFGAGTGSAFWAMREVWPRSLQKVNLVEPSQSMQRAGQGLTRGLKNLPLIHSYSSLQALSQNIKKSNRQHDLVIASYVLGEIPSLKDRITVVRQLWELTGDILVLVEPGTPQGSNIISQVRSHILWMERRRCHKLKESSDKSCKALTTLKSGAFIVAPCPHDGPCPLEKSGKYCHFVQRLERTTSQRAYKRSNGGSLRGFEDEKFSYVVFRRGQRPRQVLVQIEAWPLDGMKFETLKEQHARRNPEDLEIDYEDQFPSENEDDLNEEEIISYNSDDTEADAVTDNEELEDEQEETAAATADLGTGWGRIVYSPIRRGKRVQMDVCRASDHEGTKGSFDRIIITKSKNPTLHHQARRSLWGDLWPF
nr:rsm22-cox11 tandem protein 2, mitochondrial-like [Ipomoea batatas]